MMDKDLAIFYDDKPIRLREQVKRNIKRFPSDFILYTGNDGKVNFDVFVRDETVWLTQKAMAGLFGVKVPAISKHLANIYETLELREEPTISILETVQK
jgi:hypothetical protein